MYEALKDLYFKIVVVLHNPLLESQILFHVLYLVILHMVQHCLLSTYEMQIFESKILIFMKQ
jgi:hypothetical protein